jgi:hypothetical protein
MAGQNFGIALFREALQGHKAKQLDGNDSLITGWVLMHLPREIIKRNFGNFPPCARKNPPCNGLYASVN